MLSFTEHTKCILFYQKARLNPNIVQWPALYMNMLFNDYIYYITKSRASM